MLDSTYDISDNFITQLCNTIETIISQAECERISEYELIKCLQSGRFQILNKLSMSQSDQLFQLHFLVFHALYKLRIKLQSNKVGYLKISPLSIEVCALSTMISHNQTLDLIDPLAEYYLNLDNLKNITSEEIEHLILSFWKSTQNPNGHLDSLRILELSPPVSYTEIKKQYKRLASKYHPDKGGSTTLIQAINQAMATLSQHYKNGNIR
ncbi:DNA-J related domain-containing protein [Alkalimarinus alittae]|uniref:DnaJ domain-containing protein n=1 Tax=Alkalimarinus alittae TaxID=2961619 RepID=A0ABY6MXX9_9ALTE|nr:DNA-J related domain-containing protein [Alkalimarinus alittae]UZE94660.1 DnaJ domain-containing protein [Alkalimarinus alittae]